MGHPFIEKNLDYRRSGQSDENFLFLEGYIPRIPTGHAKSRMLPSKSNPSIRASKISNDAQIRRVFVCMLFGNHAALRIS
jgi:hypothetical protein